MKAKKPRRSNKRLDLIHVLLGIVPAMGIGFLAHNFIKEKLFSPYTVVASLVVGGLFMIYAERRRTRVTAPTMDDLTYKQAFGIGLIQILALWPGFSRSGSMAIPIMVLASGYDLLKSYKYLSSSDIGFFAVDFLVFHPSVIGTGRKSMGNLPCSFLNTEQYF